MSDLKDGFYWVKYKDMEPVIFQKEDDSWYAFGIETEADITDYEILGKVSEWSSDERSGLHLADVIARYSLPEDFEERLTRYLELSCMLKEDGLKPDDYDEYCELEEEIKDEYF